MLYHIKFWEDQKYNILTPYVPYSAGDIEDRETPRVCFADSIEHCIEAVGPCNRDLHTGAAFAVYYVDEQALDQDKLVTPETLWKTGKVPDAMEHNEYWYLKPVEVKRKVMRIKSFIMEHALNATCIKVEDIRKIAMQYAPGRTINPTEGVRQIFERTTLYLDTLKKYDEEDAFQDAVFELPWAQGNALSKLELEDITDTEDDLSVLRARNNTRP